MSFQTNNRNEKVANRKSASLCVFMSLSDIFNVSLSTVFVCRVEDLGMYMTH